MVYKRSGSKWQWSSQQEHGKLEGIKNAFKILSENYFKFSILFSTKDSIKYQVEYKCFSTYKSVKYLSSVEPFSKLPEHELQQKIKERATKREKIPSKEDIISRKKRVLTS